VDNCGGYPECHRKPCALLDYPWPGNVRELANAIEYAVAVARMETILPEDLPDEIRQTSAKGEPLSAVTALSSSAGEPETELLAEKETELDFLKAEFEKHHWRKDDTARALGLSRSTLWRRTRELHLSQ
jgi:DNA-binding NtrC family response regulator